MDENTRDLLIKYWQHKWAIGTMDIIQRHLYGFGTDEAIQLAQRRIQHANRKLEELGFDSDPPTISNILFDNYEELGERISGLIGDDFDDDSEQEETTDSP